MERSPFGKPNRSEREDERQRAQEDGIDSRSFAYTDATRTDRHSGYYEKDLGVDLEQLRGKRVLEVGSGKSPRFAKEAEKHGVELFSMNPEFKVGDVRKEFLKGNSRIANMLDRMQGKNNRPKAAAALAQELPFRDEIFDQIIGEYSVPYYLPREQKEYDDALSEMVRVLKPGGKAVLYPVDADDEQYLHESFSKLDDRAEFAIELVDEEQKNYRLTVTKKDSGAR